jgi:hypothetical protein
MILLNVGQYFIYQEALDLYDLSTALADQMMVIALIRQLVMVVLVVQVQLVNQASPFEPVQCAIDRAQTQPRFARPRQVIEIIGAKVAFAVVQQFE